MKKNVLVILIFLSCACSTRKINLDDVKYSTGHMGMPGENVFLFTKGNHFYFYERLSYSEGTYKWLNSNEILLSSEFLNLNKPTAGKDFRSLNNKIVDLKGKKLYFEDFVFVKVKQIKL